MLDASVAMPYLCSKLYVPSKARFFGSSFQAINDLKQLGATVCISWQYINECASHLLRALDYQGLDLFSEELSYSENAYISNYFKMRKQGIEVPGTIADYVKTFSPSAIRRSMDVKSVMPDLQKLFSDYGVHYEPVPPVSDAIRKDFEVEYTHRLAESGRPKSEVLIEHDVTALSHTKRQIVECSQHRALLTWDRAMIAVAKKMALRCFVWVAEVLKSSFPSPRTAEHLGRGCSAPRLSPPRIPIGKPSLWGFEKSTVPPNRHKPFTLNILFDLGRHRRPPPHGTHSKQRRPKKINESGWVISPEIALDFVQQYRPLDEMELCALAHRIARTREKALSLSASIIDKVVSLAADKLQDWQIRKKLEAFKTDLLARIDLDAPDYGAQVENETDQFLKSL